MGRPMVARLVEARHEVHVLGRAASRGELAEAAAQADVVVVCVFDDQQLRQIDAPVSGERLGVPESTLLDALVHGSATSRALRIVAAAGSITSLVEARREFIVKDVAVVRDAVGELGSNLGVLNDAINVMNVARKV
jgi:3-hydroxyisobutyrate dehydrogenase-like beta-hydroxyacid dehydrogenase